MKKTMKCLQEISHLANGSADAAKIRQAIESARAAVKEERSADTALSAQLETELSTWLQKIDVILKEPAARSGMAKHAHFWAEKLKNVQ